MRAESDRFAHARTANVASCKYVRDIQVVLFVMQLFNRVACAMYSKINQYNTKMRSKLYSWLRFRKIGVAKYEFVQKNENELFSRTMNIIMPLVAKVFAQIWIQRAALAVVSISSDFALRFTF